MASVTLSDGRVIEIKIFTRAVQRAMQEVLMQGVEITGGEGGDVLKGLLAINGDKAQEVAIRLLTWLSQEEIDNLPVGDYNILKAGLDEATGGKKKE